MAVSPLAGKPAPKELLIDVGRLVNDYYTRKPDMADPNQRVQFGTSGHRGSSLNGTFTEAHILAITQAICEYRRGQGTDGPLFMGKDTHALSGPAQRSALEVLAANGVETVIQEHDGDHADAGDLLRHSRPQPRPQGSSRRRRRHHAVAQPAGGRRLQVQPDQRRPRRHRRHEVDSGPRQHPAVRGQRQREARLLRPGPARRHHAAVRLRPPLRQRPAQRHRHGRDPRRRPEAGRRSARRRRPATTGRRSPRFTASTSRWSTRGSTRRSAS